MFSQNKNPPMKRYSEDRSRTEILSTFNFIIVRKAETSATVFIELFSQVSHYQVNMDRLYREIRDSFRREEDVTIDSYNGLLYLEAVLNEGLRICNPIPSGLPRVVPLGGDTYCGVYIPGDIICLPPPFSTEYSCKYIVSIRRQLTAAPDPHWCSYLCCQPFQSLLR